MDMGVWQVAFSSATGFFFFFLIQVLEFSTKSFVRSLNGASKAQTSNAREQPRLTNNVLVREDRVPLAPENPWRQVRHLVTSHVRHCQPIGFSRSSKTLLTAS
jgi:hypothetical protein